MKSFYMPAVSAGVHPDSGREREVTLAATFSDPADEPPWVAFVRILGDAGIDVPPNSRFGRYMKIIRDGHRDRRHQALAMLEMHQLHQGVRFLRDLGPWKAKIVEAINKDMDIPGKPGANSRGRDAQFEVNVAGRFVQAGAVVAPGEPDLVCDLNGMRFGVAAKRIKSATALRDNFIDARRQIVRSGLPGVVALDVTPVLQSMLMQSLAIAPDHFVSFARATVDHVLEKQIPRIIKDSRPGVMGFIAFAELAALGVGNNGYHWFFASVHSGHALEGEYFDFMHGITDLIGREPSERIGPVSSSGGEPPGTGESVLPR
jgi:hypothetical protein